MEPNLLAILLFCLKIVSHPTLYDDVFKKKKKKLYMTSEYTMYPICESHVTVLLQESESPASILCERVVIFQFGILLANQEKCTHIRKKFGKVT